MSDPRDIMNYDVVIIGAGPSGLAAAIHLKQLCRSKGLSDLSIAVLEKGSSVGAHILSGCVMDPKGLDELIPDWRNLGFPVSTKVSSDSLEFLSNNSSYQLPLPKQWSNDGNFVISLSQLCVRLGEYAEGLGIEIYPGFVAVSPIIEAGCLKGVITGDVGIDKNGNKTSNYQRGIEIRATQTIIAEGARGSLAKQVIKEFKLDKNCEPQTYGLGIKEIWQVESEMHRLGSVLHTIGYPLYNEAYGGGFMYHLDNNLVAVGLVTALDYKNPYLSPYEEFQKFKKHKRIAQVLKNGKRLEYGARVVVEGGVQSLAQINFLGGVLVGDSAGYVNVPKVKGVHNAIKSGMLSAIAIIDALAHGKVEAIEYKSLVINSWLYKDLYKVRNIRPAFRAGLYIGLLYSLVDYYVFKGLAPWTFRHKTTDNKCLLDKSKFKPIVYKAPDGIISFDKASSVHLSGLVHDDQPCHLKLTDSEVPIKINLLNYVSPETKYCPAGVYEIIKTDDRRYLQINAQNCVHCKACDIKDPTANITWTPPQGGSGPQYSDM